MNDPRSGTRKLRRVSESDRRPELNYTRAMILNWFLPIVILGMFAPIGLTALCLLATSGSTSGSLSSGELFLGAGSAATCSGCLLLASRPDKALDSGIAAYSTLLLIGLPSYFIWALVLSASLDQRSTDRAFTIRGGLIDSAIALLISAIIAHTSFKAYREPANVKARVRHVGKPS